MTSFSTSTVTVRGETFQVQELDGKTMREARRISETDPTRLEFFVASKGLVNPKLTEAELEARPNIFAMKISNKVYQLAGGDELKNV